MKPEDIPDFEPGCGVHVVFHEGAGYLNGTYRFRRRDGDRVCFARGENVEGDYARPPEKRLSGREFHVPADVIESIEFQSEPELDLHGD